MRIPVRLNAEFRGLARKANEWTDRETGEKRQSTDAYRFEFEDADGVVSDVALSQAACDRASDFDISKLNRGDFVTIDGFVAEGQRGMYLAPVSIVKAAALKAA